MGQAQHSYNPGIYDEVIRIIKEKIKIGIYERSNSLYWSKWFCVLKKDGKSLQIIHYLQPLNAVTVKDSGVPPILEFYAENLGGQGSYTGLDLFIAFGHHVKIIDRPTDRLSQSLEKSSYNNRVAT